MYINKALIYGNLTRDPENRALPNGTQVASFSVATNRVYKDKNGVKQENVDYHNVVMFARLAELAGQYLKKGSPVYIEGRMQTRSWDDKDGTKKYRTEIVADTMQFGPRGGGGGDHSSAPSGTGRSEKPAPKQESAPAMDTIEYPEEDINPDDIPF